jgi:hypothetical protein
VRGLLLLLLPASEGTRVGLAKEFSEIEALLKGGATLADAVIPRTGPEKAHQLTLFGD